MLLLPPAVCSTLTGEIRNYGRRAAWEHTEMKNIARLSIVIGLVLAFSFVELAGLRVVTVSGDNNKALLDQQ